MGRRKLTPQQKADAQTLAAKIKEKVEGEILDVSMIASKPATSARFRPAGVNEGS